MEEQTIAQAKPSKRACQFAMGCHLIALVGLLGNGIGFLLGPLILWLVMRKEDRFIDEQGKEAVNFQITVLIALIVGAILTLLVIGIVVVIAVGIAAVVLPIIAAIKANDGEHYRYPFSIRFIK